MKLERRDLILVAGIFLVVVGMSPFILPAYAIAIGVALFFGIKLFVAKKRQEIEKNVGEGVCLECGFTIIDNQCPNCDLKKK